MTVQYRIPEHWIRYDPVAIIEELTNAKASILSITNLPYQRSWAETLQELELKREVAGTSRIEGAEFTDHEFEEAVSGDAAGKYFSRSQRQARAAIGTYRWIAELPSDVPIDEKLIKDIHSVRQKTLHHIDNKEQSSDIFKRRNFGFGGLTGSKANFVAKYHKPAKSSLYRMT